MAGQVVAPGSSLAEQGRPLAEALAAATRVPVIAIGGVRPAHGRALARAGVHGVAVIRGIWDAPNAEQAASDYLSSHDHAGAA